MRKKFKSSAASSFPTVAQLEQELNRENFRRQYSRVLRSTIYSLITVAAVAVLVATLFLPVLRIYGTSMTPTMTDGDIVVSVKQGRFERGEIIAFWFNNKILVKRVIALPGEWIDIDEDGNVSISGQPLDEPYLTEKALGECDIEFPYQVPDGRIFVMGDHRLTSSDSRNSEVGCVAEEQVVGRLVFRVWPLNHFGKLD
jgi:signal peptidase I